MRDKNDHSVQDFVAFNKITIIYSKPFLYDFISPLATFLGPGHPKTETDRSRLLLKEIACTPYLFETVCIEPLPDLYSCTDYSC